MDGFSFVQSILVQGGVKPTFGSLSLMSGELLQSSVNWRLQKSSWFTPHAVAQLTKDTGPCPWVGMSVSVGYLLKVVCTHICREPLHRKILAATHGISGCLCKSNTLQQKTRIYVCLYETQRTAVMVSIIVTQGCYYANSV